MNGSSWLGNTRTDGLGWLQNTTTSKPQWLKRWMQPSRRSSLKQAQLTQSGYFPSAFPPLLILVLFSYVTWVRHWLPPCNEEYMPQQPPLYQSLRAHKPQPPQAVLCIKLGLHLFPFFPCWTFPLSALPQLGAYSLGSSSIPCTKSRIVPPIVHLMIDLARRPMPKIVEANVSSEHNTPQGREELPITLPEAPNNDTVASGSIEEHACGDNTNHCGDESTQDGLRENVANSNLESASWHCLTCSDTEEVSIRTA